MPGSEEKRVIILGGGVAGLAVARLLSQNNLAFSLIEKSDRLGGHVKQWACMATDECKNCGCCMVYDYEDTVASSSRSEILTEHELSEVISTEYGIHGVKVQNIRSRAEKIINASAMVIACGFETFDPVDKGFWGYGRIEGVITLPDLNRALRSNHFEKSFPDGESELDIAFFQCVGSRDKTIGADYCSQVPLRSGDQGGPQVVPQAPESQDHHFLHRPSACWENSSYPVRRGAGKRDTICSGCSG